MKVIKLFLFFILFFPIVVIAETNRPFHFNLYNDCVESQTCVLLCGHTNKVKITADWVKDAKYDYFSSYMYYDFQSKKIFVEWYSQETDLSYATHYYQLTSKYVFIENSANYNLTSKGVCPEKSYIDRSDWGVASELCIADNDTFCTKEKSKWNPGTHFKGTSTLEYNYENHIDIYFEEWKPPVEDYSCETLKNQSGKLKEQLYTDFSANYLYGNAIPDFMKNSASYQDGMNKISEAINELKAKCDAEDEEKFKNDEITEEEYEENLQKNEAGASDLDNQLDGAQDIINMGSSNVDFDKEIIEQTCTSLLGSITTEGSPAFYLSLIFNVLKYVAIIILIVLTILDFVGAVPSQDNDIIKKAVNKAIHRAIICVVIFLLPTIIEFILQFIHNRTINTCGIGK